MTELHWETHSGDGPPLLLVHGFLSSRAQWTLNLEALAGVCQPVTVELWGHGRSPSPDDPHCYTPAGYIEAFEAIRRALGVESWYLCGYSLGAGLTIGYALAHPGRIIAQVFTNSTSGFADAERIAEWRDSAERSAANIVAGGHDALARIPVHPRFAKRLPDSIHQALLADAARADPGGIANTVRFTNPGVSVRARVSDNRVPALLTCGRNERRFQPHRDYAAAHMPHLEIADLDAGHAVNMEDPIGFNARVIEFLQRHRPG